MDYSAGREIKCYDDYADGMRRLVVLAIDYANTMKPIADMNASEKVCTLILIPIIYLNSNTNVNPDCLLRLNFNFLIFS